MLGGERSMLATLPAVAVAGFEVLVAAPPNGTLSDELRCRGIMQVSWPTHDESGSRPPLAQLRARLVDMLRKINPDLVHANSLSTSRFSGPVALECGVRSIGHLRDILKLAPQAIEDLNSHCRLLAVSHAARDFHVAQGLAADRCAVVHNGVDLDEFRPRPVTGYLHRELKLPSTARLIAIIGQLGIRKATDVALTAGFDIAEQFPNVHWLVVGQRTSNKDEARDFEKRLYEIASAKPIGGRVHFLGSRTDVARLLPECDVLVHAARQEPLGRVLLEAAASGLAIVATDVGGTCEIFPPDSNAAVLVPPDNSAAIADAIRRLLWDENSRKKISARARQRAEAAFDIRTAAARLIEHYHAVLA